MTKSILLLLAVSSFLFFTAQNLTAQKIYKGDPEEIGNGRAYTWVKTDKNGNPERIGITFTAKTLNGLPKISDPGSIKLVSDFVTFEYNLEFPDEISSTPFDHVGFNWNPGGHIPPQIYGIPHFDFHFYTISVKECHKITAKDDDTIVCYKAPPAKYLPKDYIVAPSSAEPMMGSHWIDPSSPEFNGEKFSKTFIYGFYDGEMIFLEPMITKDYLETKPNSTENIKQPEKYKRTGLYYPTSYSINFDSTKNVYSVSLGDFVLK